MTIADVILAVVVVIAGVAGFAPGRRKASLLVVRVGGSGRSRAPCGSIHFNSGAGRQAVATVVLVGCGAIGLAGGQLLRAAALPEARPQVARCAIHKPMNGLTIGGLFD